MLSNPCDRSCTRVPANMKISSRVVFGMLQRCDRQHCPGGVPDTAVMGPKRGDHLLRNPLKLDNSIVCSGDVGRRDQNPCTRGDALPKQTSRIRRVSDA